MLEVNIPSTNTWIDVDVGKHLWPEMKGREYSHALLQQIQQECTYINLKKVIVMFRKPGPTENEVHPCRSFNEGIDGCLRVYVDINGMIMFPPSLDVVCGRDGFARGEHLCMPRPKPFNSLIVKHFKFHYDSGYEVCTEIK
jgi:hypothetical protein